jgi:MOSC domain-containing protein YiiM
MTGNNTFKLIKLSIGTPKELDLSGSKLKSGICKQPVTEVKLTKERFEGDDVANHKFHGGPDRAVCIYPYEHYEFWENEYQVALPQAAFGENLTIQGMLEEDVMIGDIYQIGDAIVQVTQGRIPCNTISRHNQIDTLFHRILETGYTGYFCRVLQEGCIREDSTISVLTRSPHRVTVAFANQVLFHEPNNAKGIVRILEVGELAQDWRTKLTKRLAKL